MGEFARESILHALVTAFVIGALTRTWRVEHPALRVRLGLLAVAVPVVVGPALRIAAPGRTSDVFRQATALFDAARWNDIRVFGAGIADLAVIASAAVGLVLLVRDVVPWLQERLAERPRTLAAGEPRARMAFATVARRMRVGMPPLVVLDEDAAVLHCAGVRRPAIFVSRGVCASLDDDELAGAMAHELAHVELRDPGLGWALMLARLVFWFNPVVQVVARAVTHEVERRADERAAEITGDRVALASALLKVFRAIHGVPRVTRWPVPGLDTGERTVTRFRAAALEHRCRQLLDVERHALPTRRLARVQVLLAAAGVAMLLFFVV